MAIKMYKAESWITEKIITIKVGKVTEKSIWVGGSRRARYSAYDNYFKTFDEAKTFLIEQAQKKVDIASATLAREQEKLTKVYLLKDV
jgi:DNA-binding transcriptional regulator GbsR (MarR family)